MRSDTYTMGMDNHQQRIEAVQRYIRNHTDATLSRGVLAGDCWIFCTPLAANLYTTNR